MGFRAIPGGDLRPPAQGVSARNGAILYLGKGPVGTLGVDNIDLFAVDPATGGRRNLTATRDGSERDPLPSPDGTQIVFFRSSIEQQSGQFSPRIRESLYLMQTGGGWVRELRRCEESARSGS